MGAGIEIKKALLGTDINQKKLAEVLGMSQQNLSRMLKNDRIIYNTAEEIADILGYDIVWQKRQDTASSSQVVNNSGVMGVGIKNS